MKYADLWLRVVAFVVLAFACADLAFAGDWACTQPPNPAIKKAIDQYHGPKHSISNDRRIDKLVENALEKRLGFKSDIVSCNGSTCRISKEFVRFVSEVIEIPSQDMAMSICSAHNPNCVTPTCPGEFSENYTVLYKWSDGSMELSLDISKTLRDQLHVDEFLEDNSTFDPNVKDVYWRVIGLSKRSRLAISITTFTDKAE